MSRSIKTFRPQIEPVAFGQPLETWLCQQSMPYCYLLAHAIDGVIWGKVDAQRIYTSHDVAPAVSPPLRLETLQQLRLFNADYEVRLWRAGDEWQAIRITDVADPAAVAISERQLLTGTDAEQLENDFVSLRDGAQGLRYIIPPFEGSKMLSGELGLDEPQSKPKRACLAVRHYLTEDELGVNSITISRLIGLEVTHA